MHHFPIYVMVLVHQQPLRDWQRVRKAFVWHANFRLTTKLDTSGTVLFTSSLIKLSQRILFTGDMFMV